MFEVECFIITDIMKNIWTILAGEKGIVITQKRGYGRSFRKRIRK